VRGAGRGRPCVGRLVGTQLAALAIAALVLSGCANNIERSAKLEKIKRQERLEHPQATLKGVVVTHENPQVKVVGAAVVHGEGGVAAVVTLRNESSKTLHDAPIAITVNDAKGTVLYQNNAPGLDPTLVSVPLLKPHTATVWVDDQIQATGVPATASARVGEAPVTSGQLPQVSVGGVHAAEEDGNGASVEGTVDNSSKVAQQQLVVYVVARRGGEIVAAGRAVLPEVAAGQRSTFQVFFIGSPRGAKLEASAPPTTLA
jgi:hypothetical protein